MQIVHMENLPLLVLHNLCMLTLLARIDSEAIAALWELISCKLWLLSCCVAETVMCHVIASMTSVNKWLDVWHYVTLQQVHIRQLGNNDKMILVTVVFTACHCKYSIQNPAQISQYSLLWTPLLSYCSLSEWFFSSLCFCWNNLPSAITSTISLKQFTNALARLTW